VLEQPVDHERTDPKQRQSPPHFKLSDPEGGCRNEEQLRYRHLETLINPGWRCIGSEDYQSDQDQTEQKGQKILTGEENSRYLFHRVAR
jgi:hypothetical protein